MNQYQKFIIYWDYHITNLVLEIKFKRKFYHYSFEEFTDDLIEDWYWKWKERIDIEKYK